MASKDDTKPSKMKFRCMEGAHVGRLIDLDQDKMTLGRDDACELTIDEDGISKKHALICRDGERYTIKDLESTNGVYVNGKKIEAEHELTLNDKVRVGSVLLLLTDASGDTLAASDTKPSKMKFRFMEGPHVGRLIDLDQDKMTLGRDDACELTIDEDGISKKHALICRDGERFTIKDLESTNGVYVNGKKIEAEQELALNDKVRIGSVLLLLTDAGGVLAADEVARLKEVAAAIPKPASPGLEDAAGEPGKKPVKPEEKANKIVSTVFAVIMAALAILLIVLVIMPADDPPPPGDPDQPTADLLDNLLPDTQHTDPISLISDGERRPDDGDEDHDEGLADTDAPDDGGDYLDDDQRLTQRLEEVQYYWVRSDPPGARVYINNEERGTAPLMILGLEKGPHELRLTKDGYKDLTRTFHIPFRSEFFEYSLDLESEQCLITSEPTGMAIMDGLMVIGHTPYLLKSPPGQYRLQMVGSGYMTNPFIAMVSANRPTRVNLKMRLAASDLLVQTLPANARIFIDGVAVGRTMPRERGESVAARIGGIIPGVHKVSIEAKGRRSLEQTVTVRSGESASVSLMIFIIDTEITMRNNKVVHGMLRQRNPNGDILLAVQPDKNLVIKGSDIHHVHHVPVVGVERTQ